jgi:hypothetical protein
MPRIISVASCAAFLRDLPLASLILHGLVSAEHQSYIVRYVLPQRCGELGPRLMSSIPAIAPWVALKQL